MTTSAIRLSGRYLSAEVRDSRELVDRVIAAIAPTDPAAHGMGATSIAADIRWSVAQSLRAVADVLAGREADLELIRASAIRRFEEGASLASVMTAYHRGIQEVWALVRERAASDEASAVADAGERLMHLLERIGGALAEDQERVWTVVHAGEREGRFALFTALTQGGDAVSAAHRSGRPLADRYGVLAVRIVGEPGGAPDGVAARRDVQRLRAAIDAAVPGEEVLAVLTSAGGTALVPVRGPGVAERIGESLAAAFGDRSAAGWSEASPAGVADAVGVAEELLALALVRDDVGGIDRVATLDAMLLDYQNSRPGPARQALARSLDPLSEDLVLTARRYLALEGDRRRTAAALHVHPNTVDYRLGRIAVLCGWDATTPTGAAQLRAALIAARREEDARGGAAGSVSGGTE